MRAHKQPQHIASFPREMSFTYDAEPTVRPLEVPSTSSSPPPPLTSVGLDDTTPTAATVPSPASAGKKKSRRVAGGESQPTRVLNVDTEALFQQQLTRLHGDDKNVRRRTVKLSSQQRRDSGRAPTAGSRSGVKSTANPHEGPLVSGDCSESERGAAEDDDDEEGGGGVKPAWWFHIRRYFFPLSMVARIVCCLVVVAIAAVVAVLHVPIYASLKSLEQVYVPTYSAVRYRTNMPPDGSVMASCPSAAHHHHPGTVAVASRHCNGSLDISGRFHISATEVTSTTSSLSALLSTDGGQEEDGIMHPWSVQVVPGEVLLLLGASNGTTYGNRSMPHFVAEGLSMRCTADAQQDASLFLQQHYGWDGASAAVECAPASALIFFNASHPLPAAPVVSHSAVLCRCRVVRLVPASWQAPPAGDFHWSLHVSAISPPVGDGGTGTMHSIGSVRLGVVSIVPSSILVHHDDTLPLTNNSEHVVRWSTFSFVGVNETGQGRTVTTTEPVLVRVSLSMTVTSVEFQAIGVPLTSSSFDGNEEEDWSMDKDTNVLINTVVVPRSKVAFMSDTPLLHLSLSMSVFVVLVLSPQPSASSLRELRVVHVAWNCSVTADSPGASLPIVAATSTSVELLTVLMLPSTGGLCCGAQPLQLLSGAYQRRTDELWLLGYRACPIRLGKCVQSTKMSSSAAATDSDAAYTSRVVAMKYSVRFGVVSAVLPLSSHNKEVSDRLDRAATGLFASQRTDAALPSGGGQTATLSLVQFSSAGGDGMYLQTSQTTPGATNSSTSDVVSSVVYLLRWSGGYRLDGVVLPSSKVCAPSSQSSASIALSVDVVIGGRLPYSALLGITPVASSPVVVGGLVCVGPGSASVLVASVASASRDVRDAVSADFCIGRAISDDEFAMLL